MENGNDIYTAIKIDVVAEVKISSFSYSRADVLVKLMEYAASAAQTFSPYSEVVRNLESDIAEVKNGAPLVDFSWCFPQMGEFTEGEVE